MVRSILSVTGFELHLLFIQQLPPEHQEAGINNEEATEWQDGKKITASVTVKNNGSRDADEIVQLYIRDMVASISVL